jgi:uncharacterized protein YecE (DUF72 family)
LELYIGCSGWSYSSWQGPFYPSNVDSPGYLQYYSNVFDYVEIDSSFYRIPNALMVSKWERTTPVSFKFTAKFPKSITHDKRLDNVDNELDRFFDAMKPLSEKTLALLIQLPPSMTIKEGIDKLDKLIPKLDKRFKYAVEVRHKSWYQDLAYNFFKNEGISMVWSQLAELQTPPIVTADFLYLRFIGDRTIDPNAFGRIQKDRVSELEYWSKELKRVQEKEKNLKFTAAAANNHYAGFGPATASVFRQMMGVPEAVWEAKKQPTLSDFSG